MRFTKTLVAAAALAVAGSAAFAGGPGPAIADNDVIVLPPVETGSPSSVPAGYIVLGLVAALVAASGSF